jgi:hypothetical protein
MIMYFVKVDVGFVEAYEYSDGPPNLHTGLYSIQCLLTFLPSTHSLPVFSVYFMSKLKHFDTITSKPQIVTGVLHRGHI